MRAFSCKYIIVFDFMQDTEKDMLSAQTGLHLQQVNNWFINQRKRSWHKVRHCLSAAVTCGPWTRSAVPMVT